MAVLLALGSARLEPRDGINSCFGFVCLRPRIKDA